MCDNSGILMVYMTVSSRDEADTIADMLITKRLAACVNVLGKISSVYEWEGKIEHSDEFAIIAKTTEEKYPQLEQHVKDSHSYECPCIVAMPITNGHGPFLEWVRRQV